MSSLPLIEPDTALFLDFDGTLADLAPRPELVQVEPGLVDTLRALHTALNGALAIVSGRTVAELDGFLSPLVLPAAGVHGAEVRDSAGRRFEMPAPHLGGMLARLEALAQAHPGLRIERKPMALAVHYRSAPELEQLVRAQVAEALKEMSGVEMLHGKMVVEVKPAGVTKGSAIENFMRETPFAGRKPVFAGDDVTDEDGFVMVNKLGGTGVLVGQRATAATVSVNSPAALRLWLYHSARALAPASGTPASGTPASGAPPSGTPSAGHGDASPSTTAI